MSDLSKRSTTTDSVLELDPPSLQELGDILRHGLPKYFATVEVDVRASPDFAKDPFGFSASSFSPSGLKIAEVGGPGNLFPHVRKDKVFDLKSVASTCVHPKDHSHGVFTFGPGAGPHLVVGVNCEMVADAVFRESVDDSKVQTRTARLIDQPPGYEQATTDQAQFSLMANLGVAPVAEEPQPMLHIHCERRLTDVNFPESIRRIIADHYAKRPVSLAGIFRLVVGRAKIHVMPDFPACDWTVESDISTKWLKFFEMAGPMVFASVLHSFDPGHGLRLEHTHGFSAHGDAGHYHYDVTKDEVVYDGYFAPASSVLRFDRV